MSGQAVAQPRVRSQASVAVMAATVSLLLHACLLFFFADFRFSEALLATRRWIQEPERSFELTEYEAVQVEPMPVDLEVAVTQEDRANAAGADLKAAVDALGTEPAAVQTEPPPVAGPDLKADATPSPLQGPERQERQLWDPRTELLEIDRQRVQDKEAARARRKIPRLDRVQTPVDDISLPVMLAGLQAGGGSEEGLMGGGLGPADIGAASVRGGAARARRRVEEVPAPLPAVPPEAAKPGLPLRALEDLLSAHLTVYTSWKERQYGYFRLQIERAGPEALPVLPKDIVLVQDCSASMTDQRLHFYREGLRQFLPELREGDRFQMVRFRDTVEVCFPDWVAPTPETLDQAGAFVDGMIAQGETDVFSSARKLLDLGRDPARPLVAVVVTDGRSTRGLLDSTTIIGEFTKLNQDVLSVFTFGTAGYANEYLLDLLSYCNRGAVTLGARDRWDIPTQMLRALKGVNRPVLSDVRFRFSQASRSEAYPVQTENLYLDRPLVLRGRFLREARIITFQAVGRAGGVACDMVFHLPIAEAESSDDASIREQWARQKIYHLIGQYARTADPQVLKEIRSMSREYGVEVPYKGKY